VREDKEKTDIRKDGNDKDIDKENAIREGEGFDERARGSDFSKSFVIGGSPNLIKSNISTNDDTEVSTSLTKGQVWPRRTSQTRPNNSMHRGGRGRKNKRFISIYTQTRNRGEGSNGGESGIYVRNMRSGNGEIISKGIVTDVGNKGEKEEEGVIGEDKEKGGEGTTLFYTSKNVYPVRRLPTKKRRDFDIAEGAFDKKRKPGGKVEVFDDEMNPGVVDRVKSLSCVKEEEEPVKMIFDTLVKIGVYIDNMVTTLPAT
jgi:hypothetical protein